MFEQEERAKEVRADVEDGVIRNVSIGYTIEDMDEDEEGRMIATRWSVMELSFVSVPADPNVGIGRNHPSYSSKKMNVYTSVVSILIILTGCLISGERISSLVLLSMIAFLRC